MIIPTILEDKFEEVERKINLLDDTAPIIEVDIVDNTITPGKTFLEIDKIGYLNTKSEIIIHLQVSNPTKFLKKHILLFPVNKGKINNVSTVITQIVAKEKLKEFVDVSKKQGYKVGISIKLDENISDIEGFINQIDLVQFMSVEPGRQGNDFNQFVLDKIGNFKSLYPTTKTQVDGGINSDTLPLVLETGVDNVVVGSAIFSSENPKEKYLELSAAHGKSIDNK